MGATSVSGTGLGSSNQKTLHDLGVLANGPTIIFSGMSTGEEVMLSPPSISNVVTFPYALPGGRDNYIVMLTSINGGFTYVTAKNEDDDGNFISFSFAVEAESDVMYMVAKVGSKPNNI